MQATCLEVWKMGPKRHRWNSLIHQAVNQAWSIQNGSSRRAFDNSSCARLDCPPLDVASEDARQIDAIWIIEMLDVEVSAASSTKRANIPSSYSCLFRWRSRSWLKREFQVSVMAVIDPFILARDCFFKPCLNSTQIQGLKFLSFVLRHSNECCWCGWIESRTSGAALMVDQKQGFGTQNSRLRHKSRPN